MRTLKYSEILVRNRNLMTSLDGPVYRVLLLSNIVINQLKDVLEFALREQGIKAEITCGEYDNIVQDSARLQGYDAAVVFWEAANLTENLHAMAGALTSEKLAALHTRVDDAVALVMENLKAVPLLLFNRFSSLVFTAGELRASPLTALCTGLNDTLVPHLSPTRIAIDLDAVLAQTGLEAAVDFRQFQSSRALYSLDFLKRYAEHVTPAFRAATGKLRKVLVLDCDNTLWGGILGEDGEAQLQMSDTSRSGRVFHEVQQQLLALKKNGVLLALCSKNNPEDVLKVVREHSDMLLREDDIVAQRVNWLDKASNIRALAEELNLGLDSFVFLDDSPFELGLVREELPQVCCFQVPETLSDYPSLMRRIASEFFTLSVTAEDTAKTDMYRVEQKRKELATQFSSVEDYLKSLEIKVQLTWNAAIPVSRVAQMTQKTNQFNLTTRRYTEADIARMLEDGRHHIAAISVSDRYGEYGVTGMIILRIEPQSAEASIDCLLLSCRILGRNIEQAFMDHLIGHLRAMDVVTLHAEYLKTAKNAQVADFYDRIGLARLSTSETAHAYRQDLGQYQGNNIDYIEVNAHVR